MFPTEIEMKVQRQRLEQEAENYRLVKLLREDADQPTLLERIRSRVNMSAAPRQEQGIKRAPAHS